MTSKISLDLAGYQVDLKSSHEDKETGRKTQVYVVRNGKHVGGPLKTVVTAINGGVRSSVFDSDPKDDYNGLYWSMPRGGKRSSFCIAGGAVEPTCALSKLAEVHTAMSDQGEEVFGAPAQPFFSTSGEFSYFDLSIWKNTAICDEANAKTFGGGAVPVEKYDCQPLPPKFRVLGFLAQPSHITVTTRADQSRPVVRVHFRAVFISGGIPEHLTRCEIEYPHKSNGEDGADDDGDGPSKTYEGLTLAGIEAGEAETPPDTLPMEDVVKEPAVSPKKRSGGSFGVKRPIAKKS